jgi:hypothetical protein
LMESNINKFSNYRKIFNLIKKLSELENWKITTENCHITESIKVIGNWKFTNKFNKIESKNKNLVIKNRTVQSSAMATMSSKQKAKQFSIKKKSLIKNFPEKASRHCKLIKFPLVSLDEFYSFLQFCLVGFQGCHKQ